MNKIIKSIPNTLTCISLFFGCLSVLCSMEGNFLYAVICILIGSVFDFSDGFAARALKASSAIGKELDSLADQVSFGVAPAYACYCMGVKSVPGIALLCVFCICAVIRLAFFNVQEAKRQQVETGCNKYYRGLPVTSSSILFPVFYLLKPLLPGKLFSIGLHILCGLIAFLFVLDFQVKKPDFSKFFYMK